MGEKNNITPKFQSPQWGSNSKVLQKYMSEAEAVFQSPQWGSNSKGES